MISDQGFDELMELVVHGFEIASVAVLVRAFLSSSREVALEGSLPWRRPLGRDRVAR